MKKLLLTCALISSVSVLSFAQESTAPARGQAPAPEKIAKMHADRYKQQLALSDEQYNSVYETELNFVKQEQAFRANNQPMPSGPAQQMMMAHDQKFHQVLNAEQYAKYEKMRPSKPGTMAAPNPGVAPTPPPSNH